MSYTADFLIQKRKEKWAEKHDIEYDKQFRDLVAKELLEDKQLLAEVKRYPEKLIELVFIVVDKKQKTMPFFLNEVQHEFIDKLNKAIDDFNAGLIAEIALLVLKGRQQGFTTVVTAYQLACSLLNRNFQGFTLADKSDNSEAIFQNKAKFPYSQLPDILKPTEKFNNRKQLLFSKINSSWAVDTATKDVGRSRTVNFFHGSECAFWTDGIAFIQSSLGEAFTANCIKIYESTANGYNDYQKMWDSGSYINCFGAPMEMVTETARDFKEKDFDTLKEEWMKPAYYLAMPFGGGQLRKTMQGLEMYDLNEDHPIAGSYTNSGNLRFPVDIGPVNIAQAAVFGQYANENAKQYFGEEQQTLNPEQTKIFAAMGIPIQDYWEYIDKYNDFKKFSNQTWESSKAKDATIEDVVKNVFVKSIDYELDSLYKQQKELAEGDSLTKQAQIRDIQQQMSDLLERSKLADYVAVDGKYAEVGDQRYNYSEEKDTWYVIKPKKSNGEDNWYYTQEKLFRDKLGISPADYWNGRFSPDRIENPYAEMDGKRYRFDAKEIEWKEITGSYLESEQNAVKRYNTTPEHYWNNRELYKQANEYFSFNWDLETVAKNVFKNGSFVNYAAELSQIKGEDLDGDGKSDSGTKKKKVFAYIDTLDAPDVWKKILRKMSYPSEDTYNMEIIEYMNKRRDLSYADKKETLVALGFAVDSNGKITWK